MYKFLLLIPFFFACKNPKVAAFQSKPEDAVKAFYEALYKLDLETASALGTDLTKRQLHLFGVLLKMSSAEDMEVKKKEVQVQLKNLSCSYKEGKMICTICCGADGKEKGVEMMLQKGKWFVHKHFGMEDIQKKD
jgi:hypothetical protein